MAHLAANGHRLESQPMCASWRYRKSNGTPRPHQLQAGVDTALLLSSMTASWLGIAGCSSFLRRQVIVQRRHAGIDAEQEEKRVRKPRSTQALAAARMYDLAVSRVNVAASESYGNTKLRMLVSYAEESVLSMPPSVIKATGTGLKPDIEGRKYSRASHIEHSILEYDGLLTRTNAQDYGANCLARALLLVKASS